LIPEELNGTYVVTTSNVSATYGVTIHDGTCESAIALIVVTVTDCDPPKPSELVVYNAVSPNGDGMNDVFFIENIGDLTAAGDNKVVIYNRWGDVVFEANNYDNAITVFKGLNRNGNELPTGTYYYRIEIAGSESMTGYISLKR
jgi:gliding motility-associated-like protein